MKADGSHSGVRAANPAIKATKVGGRRKISAGHVSSGQRAWRVWLKKSLVAKSKGTRIGKCALPSHRGERRSFREPSSRWHKVAVGEDAKTTGGVSPEPSSVAGRDLRCSRRLPECGRWMLATSSGGRNGAEFCPHVAARGWNLSREIYGESVPPDKPGEPATPVSTRRECLVLAGRGTRAHATMVTGYQGRHNRFG